ARARLRARAELPPAGAVEAPYAAAGVAADRAVGAGVRRSADRVLAGFGRARRARDRASRVTGAERGRIGLVALRRARGVERAAVAAREAARLVELLAGGGLRALGLVGAEEPPLG